MLKWLQRRGDSDVYLSPEDLNGWWVPFACLALTIGAMYLLTIIFTAFISVIASLLS